MPLSSPPRWLPLILALPAFLPLIAALSTPLVPTGFIQYDMAYYLANARGHWDDGTFRLLYSNPYGDYGSPAIYFQPQTALFSVLLAIHLDPGFAFNLFGLFSVAFASWAATRLYVRAVGWDTPAQRIGLLCFFWGGGLLSLLGLIFGRALGLPWIRAALAFDAGDGWWLLNFGRNLVYPTEAYYHGVFLSTMWCLLERRFRAALGLTALLAISHPFTGLSLALIVTAYFAVCRRWTYAAGAALITAGHLGYYLGYLNRFADHRALREQWTLEWSYGPWTFGPALILVGFFTLMRFTRGRAIREALADPAARLFAIWFAVIFALTQHDLFIRAMQPLHFARGYDWIALFFLAAPLLIPALEKLRGRPAALALFLLIFLSDNLIWFATFAASAQQRYAISLTRDEWNILDWLRRHETVSFAPGATVVSDNDQINYLTATYTSLRSWYGHVHNTPHAADRKRDVEQFFATGGTALSPVWRTRPMIYIAQRSRPNWHPPPGARSLHRNPSFEVWFAPPESQQ